MSFLHLSTITPTLHPSTTNLLLLMSLSLSSPSISLHGQGVAVQRRAIVVVAADGLVVAGRLVGGEHEVQWVGLGPVKGVRGGRRQGNISCKQYK